MDFRKPNRKGGKPYRRRCPSANSNSNVSNSNNSDARRYSSVSRCRIPNEEGDKQFYNSNNSRPDCDFKDTSQDRNQQKRVHFQREGRKQKNEGEVRRNANQSTRMPHQHNRGSMHFQKSSNLLIKNLPLNIPERKLMTVLNLKFTNCGGECLKVVEEDSESKTILMTFPSPEDATKARNRFRGQEVYSRPIQIEYYSIQEVDVTREQIKVVPKSHNKEASKRNDLTAEMNMTPTWVIITGDRSVKEENIQQSIFNTKLAHLFFQYSNDRMEGCRCYIKYSSQHQAKKVIESLKKGMGSRISAMIQKDNILASRQGCPLHQQCDKLLHENFEYNIGKNIGVFAEIRASGRINNIVFSEDSYTINETDATKKLIPTNPEFEVLINWTRRKNLGTAILNFESEKQSILLAFQALLEQTLESSPIEKNIVVADPSANRIILKNMNRFVTKKELISFVKSTCLKSGAKLKTIEMAQESDFVTSQEDLKDIHRKLQELVYQFVEKSAVEFECWKPQDCDDVWKAIMKFKDPQMGNCVTKVLNQGGEIDGIPLKVLVPLTATLRCTSDIFIATKDRLIDTVKQINSESLEEGHELNVSVHFANSGQDVCIEIKAYNQNDLITNSYHINKLIQGEKISVGDLRIHFFQESMEGRKMIDQIMKDEEVLILVDGFSRCLYLWGNSNNAPKTKEKLEKFIAGKALQYVQSSLFYFGNSPGFLCFLVEKFGPKFIEFCETTGCQDINVDLQNHNLELFGSDVALKQATLKLHDLKRKFIGQQSVSDEICPVCLGNVVATMKHYRLEYCGHAYCLPCISVILAHCKIPLRCCYKNCNSPMVNLDFCAFEKEFKPLLVELLNAEVRQFVQANSRQMILCPGPLCGGILKVPQENKPITCPLCTNEVCTSCQTIYHFGQTCSDFKAFKA